MAGLDLGKKVGPLPLGGWLAAAAGGVALAYAVNRKRTAAAVAAAVPAPPTDAGGGESIGLSGGIGVGGVVPLANGASGAGVAGGGVASSSDRPTFTDNDAWAAYATNVMIAKGYSPLVVAKAIQDLMGGVQLDRTEQAIVDLVIRIAGPPPLAIPPISAPPGPTAPAPPGASPQGKLAGMPYFSGVPNASVVRVVWRHDGNGGYALDNWGGIHPVNNVGHPLPPAASGGPYWPGAVTGHAVDLIIDANDRGGEVIDQLGGAHRFRIPAIVTVTAA